jgi:glutamate synthase domain-containing protein 2
MNFISGHRFVSLNKALKQGRSFNLPEYPSGKLPVPDDIVRLIHERAQGIVEPESFGSTRDVEAVGVETLMPAYSKAPLLEKEPGILVGGPDCKQPYAVSLLNCSALSYGPLNKRVILAINQAAYLGKFYQNTGEAGISPYHFNIDVDVESENFNTRQFFDDLSQNQASLIQGAGDVVWQLGTGYFGCRKEDGTFDEELFEQRSNISNVKMIEVKLSQGVEPCKSMPVKQLTPGLAALMGLHPQQKATLNDCHTAFTTPVELLYFLQRLRRLSNGKPIGIKLGLAQRAYFFSLCKAMLKTHIMPDFITIDGMEAGTAAASKGASGFTGVPLNDAIVFVHNALTGCNLRQHIKINASGKIFTEQDIITKLARGADYCSTARALLVSLGCTQQRECYKGTCRAGLATQDPELFEHFQIQEGIQKAYSFHAITIQELLSLLSIAGVSHPNQIKPMHIHKRIDLLNTQPLDELYEFIKPGSLLAPFASMLPKIYQKAWQLADPNTTF